MAAGWGASVVGHLSDMKERVLVHRFHRNYLANFQCEKCLATRHREDTSAYDFGPQAAWRSLEVSHATYLLSTPRHLQSPFTMFRSWHIHRNRMDLLHGVWLGIAKDVSGQIAYDAVMMYMPHTMQENLALLHRQMIDW